MSLAIGLFVALGVLALVGMREDTIAAVENAKVK